MRILTVKELEVVSAGTGDKVADKKAGSNEKVSCPKGTVPVKISVSTSGGSSEKRTVEVTVVKRVAGDGSYETKNVSTDRKEVTIDSCMTKEDAAKLGETALKIITGKK